MPSKERYTLRAYSERADDVTISSLELLKEEGFISSYNLLHNKCPTHHYEVELTRKGCDEPALLYVLSYLNSRNISNQPLQEKILKQLVDQCPSSVKKVRQAMAFVSLCLLLSIVVFCLMSCCVALLFPPAAPVFLVSAVLAWKVGGIAVSLAVLLGGIAAIGVFFNKKTFDDRKINFDSSETSLLNDNSHLPGNSEYPVRPLSRSPSFNDINFSQPDSAPLSCDPSNHSRANSVNKKQSSSYSGGSCFLGSGRTSVAASAKDSDSHNTDNEAEKEEGVTTTPSLSSAM